MEKSEREVQLEIQIAELEKLYQKDIDDLNRQVRKAKASKPSSDRKGKMRHV